MNNHTHEFADQGESLATVSVEGVLWLSALSFYENGNPRAKAIVERTLAMATEKGYTQSAEFHAAFQRIPGDQDERMKQVEAVFAVLDQWEFLVGIFGTPRGIRFR